MKLIYKIPQHARHLFFEIIEVCAFLLPAIPSSLRVRLLILYIYWVSHYYQLQYTYIKIKKTYINV